MKILVTGSNGFIGQNMVKALTAASHKVYTFTWGEEFPQIDNLDWVVHLGAISSTIENDIDRIITQNYDFTIKLLKYCEDRKINVQYASSCGIYGNNTDFRESAKPDPRTPYAWTKYMIDRHVASKSWDITIQGFRYCNVYGPHEDHKTQPSPYTKFTKQAKETGIIKIFEGSDKVLRDFVPVERVIEIHQRFFEIKETGVWNVGTGNATSFLEIAEDIALRYDATIEIIPLPENLKGSYQFYTKADLTKLNKSLSGVWN